ncbi:MAG: hypothetical protein R2697_07740 [Ilumatobacteraceae bacterium]
MLIDSGCAPVWRNSSVTAFEPSGPRCSALAVGDVSHHVELGLGDRREDDLRPGGLGEFEMARQEVGGSGFPGMTKLDRHPRLLGVGDVFGDVTLWVDDDGGTAGRLVADEVRSADRHSR